MLVTIVPVIVLSAGVAEQMSVWEGVVVAPSEKAFEKHVGDKPEEMDERVDDVTDG